MFIEYYFIIFLNIFRLALFSFQCNIYIMTMRWMDVMSN